MDRKDKIKQEMKKIGQCRRIRGLRLWEINTETGEVIDCGTEQKKVTIKQGCIYRQALNRKNLVRRLAREQRQLSSKIEQNKTK